MMAAWSTLVADHRQYKAEPAGRIEGESGRDFSRIGKMMNDLNALINFARVVDANSFSEAARRLKMPTSTVSRHIANLEEQLGVRLLERSTRRLRLTDIGSEVLVHARRGAELSDAVDNIVCHSKHNGAAFIAVCAARLREHVAVSQL
jgi:DNA-binding transcriptional LysR family regulator